MNKWNGGWAVLQEYKGLRVLNVHQALIWVSCVNVEYHLHIFSLIDKKVGLDPQIQFRFVSCSVERTPDLPLPQNNVKTKFSCFRIAVVCLNKNLPLIFEYLLCSMVIFDEQQPYFWLLACDSQDQRALQPFFSFSGTQSLCCFPFSVHSVTAKQNELDCHTKTNCGRLDQ